jgi:hypothetical protein
MPLIRGTASDATAYRRLNATILSEPTIRSSVRTYVTRNPLPTLLSQSAGKGISPRNTVLRNPIIVGYQFATGQVLPRSPDV